MKKRTETARLQRRARELTQPEEGAFQLGGVGAAAHVPREAARCRRTATLVGPHVTIVHLHKYINNFINYEQKKSLHLPRRQHIARPF